MADYDFLSATIYYVVRDDKCETYEAVTPSFEEAEMWAETYGGEVREASVGWLMAYFNDLHFGG